MVRISTDVTDRPDEPGTLSDPVAVGEPERVLA